MVSAFFAGLGVWELLLVMVVALIVFGPRLPEVAKSLGKGYIEFRRGLRSLESEFDFDDADVDIRDTPPPREVAEDGDSGEGDPESDTETGPEKPAPESGEEEETS